MKKRAVLLWLVLSTAGMSPGLQAATQFTAPPPPGGDKTASREVILQKQVMVKMLLSKSSVLQRASESSDPAIKQQAAQLMAVYKDAEEALNNRNYVLADKKFDHVIDLLSDTAERAPDPQAKKREQIAKFKELLRNTEGIQITYNEMRKNMSSRDRYWNDVQKNLKQTTRIIAQAKQLYNQQQIERATALLQRTYDAGVADLNRIMDKAETVIDNTSFDTPQEEYQYELAMFKSYEELIPIAEKQLNPNSGRQMLSKRSVQQSRQMAANAERQAANGQYRQAIVTMQQASDKMKSALKVMGLSLPE